MSNPPLPDFLSEETFTPAVQPEPQVDAAPAAEAEVQDPAAAGPARDDKGRFASAQAPADPPPADAQPAPAEPAPAAQAPPAQQPAQDPMAPIAALLEEREKRQAAEREARELREWRQQQEQQARRQPIPDPEQDPQGYRNFQAQQLEQVFWDQRLEMSRGFSEVRHGKELVDKAFEWGVQRCDADRHFNAQVRESKDPVGFVVEQFQRDQRLNSLNDDDWKAFQDWKAAQAAASAAPAALAAPQLTAAPAPAAVAPPAKPAAPRPSLAAAPSASGSSEPLPADGAETYRRMFG